MAPQVLNPKPYHFQRAPTQAPSEPAPNARMPAARTGSGNPRSSDIQIPPNQKAALKSKIVCLNCSGKLQSAQLTPKSPNWKHTRDCGYPLSTTTDHFVCQEWGDALVTRWPSSAIRWFNSQSRRPQSKSLSLNLNFHSSAIMDCDLGLGTEGTGTISHGLKPLDLSVRC